MSAGGLVEWRRVRPPHHVNGDTDSLLATVEALRHAWQDSVDQGDREEFTEARLRNLRRHAIETGIIERLYDVEWGVTEALVAGGLSEEVASREGGIGLAALDIIRSQFEALAFLAGVAREDRPLSAQLIRELHVAICRTQITYDATDSLGRPVRRSLHHGQWKQHPNHVRRQDGSLLQYVPPEHVQSEIEYMLAVHGEAAGTVPPLVRASWLHHAFVSIHPFEDGNGRVARALTMLVLLRASYAPLVVDRYSRNEYITALDAANTEDLRPLVRLFGRLEIVALRAELERPAVKPRAGVDAAAVAAAQVQRIETLLSRVDPGRAERTTRLANDVNERVGHFLRSFSTQLVSEFRALDSAASASIHTAAPPDDSATWWRAQIIRAARHAGFFSNISQGTWWQYLRFTVLGSSLRFVVVTQKVGQGETGVIAITVFAGSVSSGAEPVPDGAARFDPVLSGPDVESLTLTYTEDLESRWEEISDMLDRSLAAAISGFSAGLA